MSCRYCTCADCSFTDTGAVRYPIGGSHEEDSITIPRDQYELYKEAAEKWAKERAALDNGWSYNHEHCCWTCMECYVALQPFDQSPVLHAATCKAARILNLKMEGAT